MRNLYAVAYMTEAEDLVKDLYVEILAARDSHEAVGRSLLESLGSEIQSRGERIVMVNVDEYSHEDMAALVAEINQQPAEGEEAA